MAVQAQLYSDHYQNYNSMAFSNLPQDWVFMPGSSVFGLGDENKPLFISSSCQHQQDQRFQDSQRIMNFPSGYHNQVSSSSSTRYGMNGFQGLSLELERQRVEMDCFLHHQSEKLKAVLTEETRKREMMMMQNYESKMRAIIDAKDEVLTTAKMRTKELESYLSMAEKEANNWEMKAMETEVMVTDLNTKLKQARARRHEDAESTCGGYGYDDDEGQKKMVCKVCHVRSSCMLLLPCRHLCCCSGCEGVLMFCPVCESVKNGSLEVFFGLN